MTVETILKRVRRRLDQVPLNAESVNTESEVLGSISTNFSDNDLIDRLNKAVRAIVSKVKAQHAPQAISEKNSVSAVETDAIRILPRRVHLSADGGSTYTRAYRRSVDTQRRLESRVSSPGRQASDDRPVFVYEDGNFQAFPEGNDVKAFVVEMPAEVSALADQVPLDFRFERALVDYIVSSCYQTMRQTELSDFFMSIFQDDIRPYMLDVRYGSLDDHEVDVE